VRRELNINVFEYLKKVHGAIILPLIAAFVTSEGLKLLLGLDDKAVVMACILALCGVIVGFAVWFMFSIPADDKALLVSKISSLVQRKLPTKFSSEFVPEKEAVNG
jgi:hypothetical protein